MYKSLIYWYDLTDEKRLFSPEEPYPRKGRKTSRERVEELTKLGAIKRVKNQED